MIYKNSLKIMMSNFVLVTRLLVLMLVAGIVLFGLFYLLAYPVINVLELQGWFAAIGDIHYSFLQTFNLSEAINELGYELFNFFGIIGNNFRSLAFNVISLILLIILTLAFLGNFYDVAVSNSLYHGMSNNTKVKLLPSMISTFRNNMKYNLLSLVAKLPVKLGIFAIIVYLMNVVRFSGGWAIFAPFVILLAYLILKAFELVLFAGWVPAVVVFDKGVVSAFEKGIKVNTRNFVKMYANSFYIILTIVVINVVVGVATFGVGLIVTIPASILLRNSFAMVVFYSNYGMRYYVDESNVIVPAKLEQTDRARALKYKI